MDWELNRIYMLLSFKNVNMFMFLNIKTSIQNVIQLKNKQKMIMFVAND